MPRRWSFWGIPRYCWAWRIDSQLDGTLMVYDPQGKEIAYNGDYYGKDPFIDFTAPEDGDYTVAVWDFVYGGGTDYFYRLLARDPFASFVKNENRARNLAILSQLLNTFQNYYHYTVVTHRNRDYLRSIGL